MPALGIFGEDEPGMYNARGGVIDEFHLASHSDHRIWRDVMRRDVGARDLLAEKTSDLSVYLTRRGAEQCCQPVVVEGRQDDRRPFPDMIWSSIAHDDILSDALFERGVRETMCDAARMILVVGATSRAGAV